MYIQRKFKDLAQKPSQYKNPKTKLQSTNTLLLINNCYISFSKSVYYTPAL